jgi:hypothetical protein
MSEGRDHIDRGSDRRLYRRFLPGSRRVHAVAAPAAASRALDFAGALRRSESVAVQVEVLDGFRVLIGA